MASERPRCDKEHDPIGRLLKVFLALLTALFCDEPAFAWNQTGHRVTGLIAGNYLSAHARREIRTVLGNESLAQASTGADLMRASAEPFWQKTRSPLTL